MAFIKFASSVLKDSYKSFTGVFNNPNRIYGLDILRAIAIMLVVYQHGLIFMPHDPPRITKAFLFNDGVTIFFVLSGFLVGQILIKNFELYKNNRSLLLSFWMRRWLRTMPLYYFFLIINLRLSGKGIYEVKKYFIFSQNISYFEPNFFGESWSLTVEEWFYFFVPLILITILKLFSFKLKSVIPIIVLLIFLLAILNRYYDYQNHTIENWQNYDNHIRTTILGSLHIIMFGLIGAWIKYYNGNFWYSQRKRILYAAIFLFILKMTLSQIFTVNTLSGGLFLQNTPAICILLVLPYLDSIKTSRGVIYKLITCISIISYSMYLVHQVVNFSIIRSLQTVSFTSFYPLSVILKYLLYTTLTIGISFITYSFIEAPFMRLRENKKIKSLFQRTKI